MDNASFHKGEETKDLIGKTGATLLFLPPYSPNLNLIEHDFAALKIIREYNENETIDEIIKMYNVYIIIDIAIWWTLKYHYLYLRAFENGKQLRQGLEKWFKYYQQRNRAKKR